MILDLFTLEIVYSFNTYLLYVLYLSGAFCFKGNLEKRRNLSQPTFMLFLPSFWKTLFKMCFLVYLLICSQRGPAQFL